MGSRRNSFVLEDWAGRRLVFRGTARRCLLVSHLALVVFWALVLVDWLAAPIPLPIEIAAFVLGLPSLLVVMAVPVIGKPADRQTG